ncbi:collagen-like protein [uncultured Eudoraea sp.]|uniref:collagen-like protein n=1 Tax=uncultured Eudoraea sp. TaxID=1035614 RepID=UPI002639A6F6|nr:collagen-like protein [uncultured Eudoraea sp.]
MKNIKLLFGAFLALIILSCEGPIGPPGPPGFDGLNGADGVNILGQVLEIEGTFDAGNEYSLFYEFPQTIEVFESDVVLVYILWDVAEDGNGEPLDIWRLLPQTRILAQGLLQYNYDFTFLDVSVFLESDFDLGTLTPEYTDNQVFRIAIVPAEFAQSAKMDTSNIGEVMSSLNIREIDISRIQL